MKINSAPMEIYQFYKKNERGSSNWLLIYSCFISIQNLLSFSLSENTIRNY